MMHPMVQPQFLELVDKRKDVLYPFQMDSESSGEETVLRLCQGLVLEVCENRSKPVVNVEWDAMLDVNGYDESSILEVILLPSKWKKDVAMSWRMDVDVDVDEGEESESGSESDSETESETDGESEGEIDSEIESKIKSEEERE